MGEAAGPFGGGWDATPGRGKDLAHGLAVEPPTAHLRTQQVRGLARAKRAPMGSRFGHRVVGIGCGEQPVRWT